MALALAGALRGGLAPARAPGSLRRAPRAPRGAAGAAGGAGTLAAGAAAAAALAASRGGQPQGPRRRRGCAERRAAAGREEVDPEFDYGTAEYWDNRYKVDGAEKTYDWLGGYDKFREYIERAAARAGCDREGLAVLDLGCGNASLAEAMYDDGFRNITAVDISPTVIDAMRERNAEKRPGIRWQVADAFGLEFEEESFDVVIDKSTMDAIACDLDRCNENVCRLMTEVSRVLRTGGTYLVFSSTEDVGRKALSLRCLLYRVQETDIGMAFASLTAYEAVKQVGANGVRIMQGEPTLRDCIELDRRALAREKQMQEAESRLQQEAPSSFGLLD